MARTGIAGATTPLAANSAMIRGMAGTNVNIMTAQTDIRAAENNIRLNSVTIV
ncbi:hypothetical protein [Sphingomonas sp. 28-62-20]|uniref:hypothetical protein n=1 Tax=Sphingomonas sp. 28-62-20 TaxID=1970433 RepID=UPI0035A8562A